MVKKHLTHKGSGLASGLHIGIRLRVHEVAKNIDIQKAGMDGGHGVLI